MIQTSKIKIFSVDNDRVVKALVATGRTDYRFAIDHITPLVDRLDIQRKLQNPRFYERLKRDMLKGCVMPPITLAFVRRSFRGQVTPAGFQRFVNTNIDEAFVLDGIQRLNTLHRANTDAGNKLRLDQPLFVNVLLCPSMDNLLYRMITLNNGQRPMTTRHQIEILSANWFKVTDGSIKLTTEKDGSYRTRGVFAQSDFILGYMAFMSNSINVDSQKLIQEKLDDLIASKILEHDPSNDEITFSRVTKIIGEFCADESLDKWFKVQNNLIGFCAGIRDGHKAIDLMGSKKFREFLDNIEGAISHFDVSKLKLGRTRREVVAYCMKHAVKLKSSPAEVIAERVLTIVEP